MTRAAVEDAKQCVSLNTNWAKGHLRLASAYVSLGGHSNEACNELQTTLRLDPGNSLAREMLVRELRRDHSNYSASSYAAESEDLDDPPESPDYVATESRAAPVEDPVDDSISWTDRFKFYAERVTDWYNSQLEAFKTSIKIAMVLLVLYVAFGGRFGLESISGNTSDTYGNYERGNAYDQYYRRTSYSNDYDYSSRYSRGRGYSSTSFHFPNLFDGSLPSFAILIAVAYICHLNGINPFHAIMVLNMIGRRGRGGRVMYGGGYGGGMRRGGRRRW